MLQHKHILINAKVKNPLKTPEDGVGFLTRLVYAIQMKIIKGPFASYVEAEGNRGLTAIVMIETSHIAFHIWDEKDPAMLQFDLYTCGELDKDIILEHINREMQIESMDWVLFDREDGFKAIDSGAK
jgi:S-adenosylmethionine/arginine decarboxylase-like enzyme